VIDFPNSSKAKKLYLVIDAGGVSSNHEIVMIEGLKEEESEDEDEKNEIENLEDKTCLFEKNGFFSIFYCFLNFSKKIHKNFKKNEKPSFKTKSWILKKKDRQRRQVFI